jgi:diamine N-acetyltransferase
VRFQGRFTTLRPLAVEDAQLTLGWRLSQRARFLQSGAKTVEEQSNWIASSMTRRGEFNFIIEYKDEPVGTISLTDINSTHKTVVMGRELIGEEEKTHQAPVAFEAELLLCDYVFDGLRFHKIYGDVMEDNAGVLRTRRYLGYVQDGILRDHYIYDGVYKNTVAFSLLEDEYRKVCRPKLLHLIALFAKCSLRPSVATDVIAAGSD